MKPIIGIPCALQKPQDELGVGASAVPQSYLKVLEAVGAVPLLIPVTGQESILRALYQHLDGLYKKFIVELDRLVKDKGMVIMALPVWKMNDKWLYLKSPDKIKGWEISHDRSNHSSLQDY